MDGRQQLDDRDVTARWADGESRYAPRVYASTMFN